VGSLPEACGMSPGAGSDRSHPMRINFVQPQWRRHSCSSVGPLPEVLGLCSRGCAPATLKPGRRYLCSSADALGSGAWDSLAWRLGKGDLVHPARFHSLLPESYPQAPRAIRTFDEALAAVAPKREKARRRCGRATGHRADRRTRCVGVEFDPQLAHRSAYPASSLCWLPSRAMMRVAMRSSMTESGSRSSPRIVRTPTRPA
jgi:hypothetical protein